MEETEKKTDRKPALLKMSSMTDTSKECPDIIHRFIIELREMVDYDRAKPFMSHFPGLESSEIVQANLSVFDHQNNEKKYKLSGCTTCFNSDFVQMLEEGSSIRGLENALPALFGSLCREISSEWEKRIREIYKLYWSSSSATTPIPLVGGFVEDVFKPFVIDDMEEEFDNEEAVLHPKILAELLEYIWYDHLRTHESKYSEITDDLYAKYYDLFLV